MNTFLIRRFLQSLLVLLGVSAVVFFILHLTGDPTLLLLPPDATAEEITRFRQVMGFNDPVVVQYLRFLKGAVQGNFGESLRHGEPALDLVIERMPATFELTAAALAIALCLAIPSGIVSAVKRNTLVDYVSTVVALLGQSMPTFWLGIMLILVFSVRFHLLPSSGSTRSRTPPSRSSPSSGSSSARSWAGPSSRRRSSPGRASAASRSRRSTTGTSRWCRRRSFSSRPRSWPSTSSWT